MVWVPTVQLMVAGSDCLLHFTPNCGPTTMNQHTHTHVHEHTLVFFRPFIFKCRIYTMTALFNSKHNTIKMKKNRHFSDEHPPFWKDSGCSHYFAQTLEEISFLPASLFRQEGESLFLLAKAVVSAAYINHSEML